MSVNTPDECLEELKKLIALYGEERSLSELDTRAKIIDPMFMKCLGWNEKDIRRETHIHDGFLDYIFSIDGARKFVLEAKKEGETFTIPISLKGRYYTISGTISTDKKIDAALRQAQDYCINSGVKFGIVSNGKQYIIFEGFKFNASWRQSKCVVFHSLDDIRKHFSLFLSILGKESVDAGSLRKYVSKEGIPPKLYRPLDDLHSKGTSRTRNNLSPLLQPLINYVFKGIIDESQLDVLERCYVTDMKFRSAGIQIRHHFDRPPGFAKKYQVKIIGESRNGENDFQKLYDKYEDFLRTKAPKGSLCVLMGGIGSGKTTFLHYFFNFIVKKPESTFWFYVDFTKAPPDPTEIQDFIFESISKDFERKYRDALKEELDSIGLKKVKPELSSIRILFSWLTLKGYTLSLVLDNTDQHSYVSPRYQERALLIAKNLTETLKTVTILTLREESFFRSTMSGVLDAFPPAVFHISSPNFDRLIRSRIEYVLNLLEKTDEEIQDLTETNVEMSTSRTMLKMFFGIIKNSLRPGRRKAAEILRFIDDVSGGNMRLALDFFTTFLISGNTDVDEMLDIELRAQAKGDEGYQVPFHHVIKSILLEHSVVYSSSRSKIMNLFDINPLHTSSHFLHLRLLKYLHNRMSHETVLGRGFVEIDSIIQEAERMSITKGAIKDSLVKMAFYGLVEFENQSKKGFDNAAFVRITNTGVYYLEELVRVFVYLDLVWIDTPLSDRNLVKELLKHVVELKNLYVDESLAERFLRTDLFLDYLRQYEEMEFKTYPEMNDSDLTQTWFIPDIMKEYNGRKEYILKKRKLQKERYLQQ